VIGRHEVILIVEVTVVVILPAERWA
jgi:hypothetical protein